MSTVPPIFSMLVRTTSMPTPRPENCVTWSAVEKPGRKIRLTRSRSFKRSACSAVMSLAWIGLGADPLGVDAGAVVADLDDDLAPFVEGVQRSRPSAGLPRPAVRAGGFDAVVDGVAHQVRQRVADGLDDRLVQLGLLALHLDPRLFAAGHRQVADHARKLAPDRCRSAASASS